MHAEYNSNDPDEENGMEWGTFTWNESNGLMNISVNFDNNGGSGLSDLVGEGAPFLYINVIEDEIAVTIDETGDGAVDDSLKFRRVESNGILGT